MKNFPSGCTFLFAVFILFSPPDLAAELMKTEDLCEILETIEPGDHIPLVLTGVYEANMGLLYTPEKAECSLDAQPSTYVEFPDEVRELQRASYERLKKFGSKDNYVRVALEGSLHGTKAPGDDNPKVARLISFANRSAASRYGHFYLFRTKFVVTAIRSVERVPDVDLLPQSKVHRPSRRPNSLVLQGADLPSYPQLAKNIGIQGKVVIQVKIEKGAISRVEAISGDRMLSHEAIKNIKSWKFPTEVNRTFTTSFVYRLELRTAQQRDRIEVDFDLPRQVTVVSSAKGW